MAHEQFRIPGDAGFALGSFFPAPASSQEGELCRSCFKQAREEMGRPAVSKVYDAEGPHHLLARLRQAQVYEQGAVEARRRKHL